MPEGFKLFDGSADGFFIALPVEWITLDLRAEDWEAALAVYGDQIPAAMADQMPAMMEQGIKLFAMNPFGADPQFAPNLGLGVYARGPMDDLDLLEQIIPQQMEVLGATLLGMERIELSSEEAIFVEYELPVGDSITAAGQQYYVLTETTGYVVTLTDASDRSEKETFDAIMRTFQPVG